MRPAGHRDGVAGRGRWVFPAALLLAATAALPEQAPAARRQKTVFLSQPSDWAPEVEEDGKPATLIFETAWTWNDFKSPLAGDPVACGGSIVAASRGGEIAALDPAQGKALWSVDLEETLAAGPASDGERLFVATSRGRLRAFKGRDGAPLWTADLPAEPVVPPRVIGARVLLGTSDGSLVSIETDSGRIAATRLLPGRASTTAEPAPGAVLVGTDHGAVLALDESSLEVRFRHDVEGVITSPPTFEGGRVWFAAADRGIHCLRFRSGREIWVARTGAECTARPMVHGPYLYVLCFDNDIYVFGKRNGHQLTRVRLDHRLVADAVAAKDHLFVVPFTESSVVGLTLPGLRKVGRFDLQAPGEWFTTAPLWLADRIALGYGRSEGRILSLRVSEQAAPAKTAPETKPGDTTPPAGPPPAAEATPPP